MVFTNLQPFPYAIQRLSNISPFTYADGTTYLEILEGIRVWLNETLVTDTNTSIDNAIDEFQKGIENAENRVIESEEKYVELVEQAISFIETFPGAVGAVNVRQFKLEGAADDAAAISAAHAAKSVVAYPEGDYTPGASNNLYGAYTNANGPRWQAGRPGFPTADARPIMWVQKHSSATRTANSAEWDNGAGYFADIKEAGSAFGAALTGYSRHQSSDGGQQIGVHARASAYKAESEVWAAWVYGHAGDPAVIPKSVFGLELDMNIKTVDQGWMVTGGVGASVGLLVVTADNSNPITAGIMLGRGMSAPLGKMWTGINLRADAFMPSGSNLNTQVNNGEAMRIMGSTSIADAYGGLRFQYGNLRYAISTAEVTISNNAAILLRDAHRIVVGAGPASTKYLEFNEIGAALLPAAGPNLNLNNMVYALNNNQVVGGRKTGWGAATGVSDKTTWATYTAPVTVSATYLNTEFQTLVNHVQLLSRHVAALQNDLTNHGLIGV